MNTHDTSLMEKNQLKNPPRILIVDDEEAARYGMNRALGTNGYQLAEASSVPDARSRIEVFQPDLILLDVNLPGESGLDFLLELRKEKRPPLVVMITAYGSERTAVEAIKAGAHDYLSKPFEIDELRLVVKNALETIQLRRENQQLLRQIEKEERARVFARRVEGDGASACGDRESRRDGRDRAGARRVGDRQRVGGARNSRARCVQTERKFRRTQLCRFAFGVDRIRAFRS